MAKNVFIKLCFLGKIKGNKSRNGEIIVLAPSCWYLKLSLKNSEQGNMAIIFHENEAFSSYRAKCEVRNFILATARVLWYKN